MIGIRREHGQSFTTEAADKITRQTEKAVRKGRPYIDIGRSISEKINRLDLVNEVYLETAKKAGELGISFVVYLQNTESSFV